MTARGGHPLDRAVAAAGRLPTTVERIDAPVGVVFDALTSAASYPDWLVGSRRIRAVDASWPAPGSSFHHTVGVGPIMIRDHTEVVAIEPPSRLVLGVHIGPFGDAVARFSLRPDDDDPGSTVVELDEQPRSGAVGVLWWAAQQPVVGAPASSLLRVLVRSRNGHSLERLRELIEAHPSAVNGDVPDESRN